MEAPDKIYVEVCEDGIFAFEKPPFEESIEYLRKDALMEWAEDVKAKTGWYEIEVAMDDLIDKLNSM